MRYQSAMALGALAAGQAAASNHGHANFHKRHEVKARGADAVNWDNVALDLSAVDWSKVDYGNGAASTPAASTPAAETPASSQPEVVATPASSSAAVEAPSSTEAAAPAGASVSSESVGDIVGDILSGIESFATKLGAQLGVNSETENGQIWIGGDGKHSATFTNGADKDAMVWCWGKSTMWINANQPLISIKLAAGETQKLSVADGFSGGCGASFDDSDLFMGLLNESILEFTFGSGANGCFDISREINMKGIQLTAKGAKCTSGLDGGSQACTFVCTDSSATRCGAGGGDYAIDVGTSTNGPCMVGKDPFTGDAAGGCQMADDGEHLEVTIHGARW
ncbi:hypothetical protein DPSP01_010479 [Paraphaeosphaeria sporulosa]|uniref:Allergen Asp f 4 n=1 Tax=Paraphaeosphaeria sporulosa TaxID=1460663 RepID=A0A177BZC4_9PLEO|nr:uncharacterized protein CC84DRAFT_1222235 [Paraphaeosphaeria sporulosa]OAF99887.1 hypothetical protein CC84DRAFT_1222235 [Paraphaeosphaeria sporulosa]